MKLGQNVASMKSQMTSNLGHVGSKTGSLDQILEKTCVRSRGHIFSPILVKLGQNVTSIKFLTSSKMGHMGI